MPCVHAQPQDQLSPLFTRQARGEEPSQCSPLPEGETATAEVACSGARSLLQLKAPHKRKRPRTALAPTPDFGPLKRTTAAPQGIATSTD